MKIKLTGGLELDLTEEQKEELIAQLGVEESKVWKPEKDERFILLNEEGKPVQYFWCGIRRDFFHLSIGNVFQTEAQAEEALKTGWVAKLQARKRLDDYITEKGYDIDVNWGNHKEPKYCILYNSGNESLLGNYHHYIKTNDLPYFKNSSDRDDVMKNCAEEYKILLGVK